jgi:hypothetical protein
MMTSLSGIDPTMRLNHLHFKQTMSTDASPPEVQIPAPEVLPIPPQVQIPASQQFPAIKPTYIKSSGRFKKYNMWFSPYATPLKIELDMITQGGTWTKSDGETAGNGLYYHYRRFQEIAWPEKIWEKGPFKNYWAEKCLEVYLNYKYIGACGCASSGKSDSFGGNVLTDWYAHSSYTTVLVSSTDLKSLELRIWGMIKKYHRSVKSEHNWIPGYLIEGKQMLTLNPKDEAGEGRDFKNGIIAVATRKGNTYVGIQSLIGIHNKRVRILADELQLMPRAFLDSASNLSKCEDFKLVGLGNPSETTNAHGFLCEPSVEMGGWEGGADQMPGTKTWPTRFPNGICIQLPGNDSPNMAAPPGEPPPFPFLITREHIADEAKIWGVDDWHHQMFVDAKMPRGQGSRRVLTRQACLKFKAFESPNWRDSRRTRIAFLDAAYRGVGGDRCVFGELQFGYEVEPLSPEALVSTMISQSPMSERGRQIIALIDLMIVPIDSTPGSDQAEDQIVKFVMEQCVGRGIVPGNFFYDAGMRTSLVTAFSRLWDVNVNSIDCGGKPSEKPVSAEITTPCRDYYSKFVTELWFSVRYAVEAGQFRGMTEEACTEFCQREWKMVSGNRIEIESKDDMRQKSGRSPDCFVSGTMIDTPSGEVPIERICIGDMVETPFGPSAVIAVHCVETSSLFRSSFSDGSSLTGKGSHRVFTWTRGWIKLCELKLTDRVEGVKTLFLWHLLNALFTKAGNTGFKALADTFKTATTGIIRVRDFYTESSGLSTMGLFLRVCVSIIRMTTGAITQSKILNSWRSGITGAITCWNGSKTLSLLQEIRFRFQRLSKRLLHGMEPMPAESGTANTPRNSGRTESLKPTSVMFAESNLSSSHLGTPNTAPIVASKNPQENEMSLFDCVWNVVKSLVCLSTNQRNVAPISVLPYGDGKSERVYNLTLVDHNAYYANGILVQNCADAVSVGLFGARQRGFVITKLSTMAPKIKRGPDWRDELRKKARKLITCGQLNQAA